MDKLLFIFRYLKSQVGGALYLYGLKKRFPGVIFRSNISIIENGSNLSLGKGTEVAQNTVINCGGQQWSEYKGFFHCGENCYIGPGTVIFAAGEVEMGDHSLLSPGVHLISHQHSYTDSTKPYNRQPNRYGRITIGRNVWIGASATILPGVTIGDNAIIGANALVNKDVPAGTIVAGVPAREIKKV